jgi:hypothetical protein
MYLAVPVPEEGAAVFAADPTTGNRHRPEPTEPDSGADSVDVEGNLRWLAARRGLESE